MPSGSSSIGPSSIGPSSAPASPAFPSFKKGEGLSTDKLKFGNFLIDVKKLKHNVLSITNKAGHKVKGFPNVEISDNFKKVFTKQKVNSKKLVLSENERAYLQHLLQKSDAELSKSKSTVMGQPVAYMSDDVKELKDRLNILIGELDANNDSPAIKDEISQIITRLVQKNKINREQAAEFMKTFVLAL
jgi:polyhydroxyalkanoate synthesis regulator phasin